MIPLMTAWLVVCAPPGPPTIVSLTVLTIRSVPSGMCQSNVPPGPPVPPNATCVSAVQDHVRAKAAGEICGTRLPRRNPCWEEGKLVACLPAFYLLGEMKSATTTLYRLLAQQPGGVRFVGQPALEVEPRREPEPGVRGPRIAVHAAVLTASVRVDGAIEGHVRRLVECERTARGVLG